MASKRKYMEKANSILQQYWGYPSFRPLQEDIIAAVLAQKDVIALMPTGGGKSICFQVPALLQEGVCLVVSPLIALMQDQVSQLRKQGISAAALHSGLSGQEIDIILDNCIYGRTKFLYLSPERLSTALFRTRVAKMKVSLLVVDEAHCISQWGHDFRPAYRDIAAIKPLLGGVNLIALTATATGEVKQDIESMLALKDPLTLQKSFARPNLFFQVKKVDDRSQALFTLLQQCKGSAIVYAGTRKETRWIADYLQSKGISATYYHAGLTADERRKRHHGWIKDAIRVIVATNAFGMGIDKADVRLVAHLYFPPTLEAYYQEAGRGGRDGEKTLVSLLYEAAHIAYFKKKTKEAYPEIEKIKMAYQQLANYFQIAIGSHAGVSYPFDLEDFAHTYDLKIPLLYTLLHRLEEAGLIQYNDRFARAAQIYVKTSSQQLYFFQVKNPNYDPLIKTLNHFYATYIFTELTPISLPRLAKELQSSPRFIHKALQEMHDLDLLTYIPQKKEATITFLTPRYPAARIPISPKTLLIRKKKMMEKSEAVLHYMTHQHRCRRQLLLEYFEEISYEKCNFCDICKSKQVEETLPYNRYLDYKGKILALLEKKPLTLHALVEELASDIKREAIFDTLRNMMEEGIVTYTQSFQLTIHSS